MNDKEKSGTRALQPSSRYILLVDDEVDILPEYQDFLEMEGFNALTSPDPEEAFALAIAREDIALVVTDLRMARLDGASLIRKLRAALPQGRHVAFIVLTGDATYQANIEDLGVPVLIKPVDPAALVAEIRTALAAAS